MDVNVNMNGGLFAAEKIIVWNSKISTCFFICAAWVFALEYALYVVTDDLLDKLIKIFAFVCMALFVRYRRNALNRSEMILIILFSLLFLFTLIPSLLMGDWVGVSQWLKLALMSMILPILILCYYRLRGREDWLIAMYIAVAAIFSIQGLVAFFMVYWGVFDRSNIIEIARLSGMEEVSFGIWGYGNAIQNPLEKIWVLRPQGWFLEPSLLASFLLLPAFVSAGRFWQSRKKIYLFSAIIIFAALFATMSLAGYIAVVAGLIFLTLSKPLYRRLRKISFLKYSYPIVILGTFFIGASLLVQLGQQANEVYVSSTAEDRTVITTLFRRDPEGQSGNLLRERYKLNEYISMVKSNPLGIGFAFTASSTELQSANAFIYWAVAGGIPAMILVIAFFAYIFFVFCHPMLIFGNVISQCLAASFIGHAIQNISYGNWLAPYFLIHLALVVMCAKNRKIIHLDHMKHDGQGGVGIPPAKNCVRVIDNEYLH